jgi:hypothetical protein
MPKQEMCSRGNSFADLCYLLLQRGIIYGANHYRADDPLAVDEIGGRCRCQFIQRCHPLIVIQDISIGHAKLLHELLRGLCIVNTIDAQDHTIFACRINVS